MNAMIHAGMAMANVTRNTGWRMWPRLKLLLGAIVERLKYKVKRLHRKRRQQMFQFYVIQPLSFEL